MGLWKRVPEPFFSLLTSKHRYLYLKALFVVLDCYRTEIVVRKDDLIAMLSASLEDQMLHYDGEEEELKETPVSERAHALLRKLRDTGWVEPEQAYQSFDEFYIIPDYSHKLIAVLKEIDDDRPQEYNSLVSTTYSALLGADQARGEHGYDVLHQVYRMTKELRDMLVKLSSNMRKYHQAIQELTDVRNVLQEHFDNYHELVNERIYHPLKTFDSVDRFKISIVRFLKSWLIDDEFIETMAKRPRTISPHNAKDEIFGMLNEIIRIYEQVLPQLQSQIDKKHNAYIKASVNRMQYLMNRDQDFKGRLIQVLKRMGKQSRSRVDSKRPIGEFPLYETQFVHEDSLYKPPKRREKHDPAPEKEVDIDEGLVQNEMNELEERVRQAIDRKKVERFIRNWMKDRKEIASHDLPLETMDDFVHILMSVIVSDEAELPYIIDFLDNDLLINGYRIPEMIYRRVEKRQ